MSSSVEVKNGRITQIIGPVVDVTFPTGKLPSIYNALVIQGKNEAGADVSVTCEVQQLLGDNCVRAVAMSGTDGLMRGMDVVDTGKPLTVPVGKSTLGRIFNVLGEPVDNLGPVNTKDGLPVSTTSIPRIKPSVPLIATARTQLSPNNCCTSQVTETSAPASFLP